MENLIYILLLGPVIWFGFQFYSDSFVYERKFDVVNQMIPLFIFIAYFTFLVLLGPERSIHLFKDVDSTGRSMGFWIYGIPGFIFAFIMFPQQIREMTNTNIVITDSLIRGLGWLSLMLVSLRHLVVLTLTAT